MEKVLVYVDPKTGQPLFCGTMDLVAKLTASPKALDRIPNDWVDGETYLVDYKGTSSQPRSSHALQMAAYRYSTHYLGEDGQLHEMVPIDHAAVVLLNGGKKCGSCYRMYKLDTSPVVFSVFKSLLRIHNFQSIEDRVIGGDVVCREKNVAPDSAPSSENGLNPTVTKGVKSPSGFQTTLILRRMWD